MLLAVAPVLHSNIPLQPLAVKVAVSTPHKVSLVVVIVGVVAGKSILISNELDTPLVPQVLLQVAV